MSRSYKKNAIIKDGSDHPGRRKKARRFANKIVRKEPEVSNNSNFKKQWDSWNISDWKLKYFPNDEYYQKLLKQNKLHKIKGK